MSLIKRQYNINTLIRVQGWPFPKFQGGPFIQGGPKYPEGPGMCTTLIVQLDKFYLTYSSKVSRMSIIASLHLRVKSKVKCYESRVMSRESVLKPNSGNFKKMKALQMYVYIYALPWDYYKYLLAKWSGIPSPC